MSLKFSLLSEISKGEVLYNNSSQNIDFLVTDSRTVNFLQGSVFFALEGKQKDGHTYIPELFRAGIRQFVLQDPAFLKEIDTTGCNVFLAENPLATLQDMATYHRKRFSIPVIAITGSNGKTIVKEWLNQLLSPVYSVVKSPKSYNSQIGVPLSVWQIQERNTIGIFEAGISRKGEMVRLEKIIQPSIGIFTNIGPAHSEGFSSLKEKIEEKSFLFEHCKVIIYRSDYKEIHQHLTGRFRKENLLDWSESSESVYKIEKEQKGNFISLKVRKQHIEYSFVIPFKDDASFENVTHCIVLMLHLQMDPNTIQQGIRYLTNIPMRLELKEGRNNSYVIDDTYNNDIEGLKIALQFMQQQNLKSKKVVILSDMLETGRQSEDLYREVATVLQRHAISKFAGVGPELLKNKEIFPAGSVFFPDAETLIRNLKEIDYAQAVVLVKGARAFRFERIVQEVAYKIHRTVLEINLNALAHNLNVFRAMLAPGTKIMVMVKSFAYGSGSHEVAHLLQYHKVDYLAVAYTDEGIALRENNITIPVMVMNPTPEEFDKLFRYNLEPEIYNFRLLTEYCNYSERHISGNNTEPVPPVHLAIDTGMHRLGFEEFQIEELTGVLVAGKIRVASVFSHLAGADESQHDSFTEAQHEIFVKVASEIERKLNTRIIRHLLNSAGITRFSNYQYDMVRLGIGLYGVPAEGHPAQHQLQNVSTLKTVISQIRSVKKGDSIGYSRKGTARNDTKVATVAIGYGDGYSRKFSNGAGKMYVNGQLAPVIGNVCMDLCMLDVTGIDAAEGDEVVVFGKELPVTTLSQAIGTIPYEIMTSVSERVKRVFFLD